MPGWVSQSDKAKEDAELDRKVVIMDPPTLVDIPFELVYELDDGDEGGSPNDGTVPADQVANMPPEDD